MLAPLLFVVILVAASLAVGVGGEAATVKEVARVVVLATRSSGGGVKSRRLAGNWRRHRQARPTLSRPNAAALFQDTRQRRLSRRGRGAATAGWDSAGCAERSRFDWVRGW